MQDLCYILVIIFQLLKGRRMSFCTVINCMDGRVQECVNSYMKDCFSADYVDVVTEAGPVRIVSEGAEASASIFQRVDISVDKHESCGIGVAAHYDCAGNPVGEDVQLKQLKETVAFISEKYAGLKVVGLWIDEKWSVREI